MKKPELRSPVPTISDVVSNADVSLFKQFWKIVIMFCTHIYQKTSINTIILGNAHITKPSSLKQLN